MRTHVMALADGGVIDPANVKYKIAKADDRRARVAQLAAEGASQGKIAEELGVNQGTVSRDLAYADASKSHANASEQLKPTIEVCGTFETIVIDPPWPMTKIERDVRP